MELKGAVALITGGNGGLGQGGPDVFVHISAAQQAGLHTLSEGQSVSYETEQQRNGKTAAVDLREIRA
jgi:cold shock protein